MKKAVKPYSAERTLVMSRIDLMKTMTHILPTWKYEFKKSQDVRKMTISELYRYLFDITYSFNTHSGSM